MTHTPGPWEIESTVSAHYIESEGCEVARVDLIGAIEGLENVDLPNARLIASAPDLLAALKNVAEQIAAYDYLHGENSCAIDDAPALAAIRDLYPCYDPTSNIYPATKATGQEEK
jgi:hypothetical protein